jgi:hypothetical protein
VSIFEFLEDVLREVVLREVVLREVVLREVEEDTDALKPINLLPVSATE